MKIEDQETLNEIFLGKEDPELAFKRTNSSLEELNELGNLIKHLRDSRSHGNLNNAGAVVDIALEETYKRINKLRKETL